MGTEIYINNANIEKSQIGGKNNYMRFSTNDELEWKEIENIWKEVLKFKNLDKNSEKLTKEALRLTEKKDKKGLAKLIKDFFSVFTKEILTGAAAEIVLQFIL